MVAVTWKVQAMIGDSGCSCARKGQPYLACGPVAIESIEGDRPMSIVWQLQRPLPAHWFREFSVLRGA